MQAHRGALVEVEMRDGDDDVVKMATRNPNKIKGWERWENLLVKTKITIACEH